MTAAPQVHYSVTIRPAGGPSMNVMRTDPETVHAVASALTKEGDDLADDIDALARDARSVMDSDWTGDASNSHRALWTEWVESARAVVAALLTDAELLHQAAAAYDDTDESSAASLKATLSLGEF